MPAVELEQTDYEQDFTGYSELNELLKKFQAEAERDQIWFAAEAKEIGRNRLGKRFCGVIRMALDTAKRQCMQEKYARDRYIRFRSRHTQKQIFIKISFPCVGGKIPDDVNVREISRITLETGCYFRIQADENAASIHMAIPD